MTINKGENIFKQSPFKEVVEGLVEETGLPFEHVVRGVKTFLLFFPLGEPNKVVARSRLGQREPELRKSWKSSKLGAEASRNVPAILDAGIEAAHRLDSVQDWKRYIDANRTWTYADGTVNTEAPTLEEWREDLIAKEDLHNATKYVVPVDIAPGMAKDVLGSGGKVGRARDDRQSESVFGDVKRKPKILRNRR